MKIRYIALCCVLMIFTVGCTSYPERRGIDSAEAEYIRAEVEYFRSALTGKYSQSDITNHYKDLRITDYLDYYFESMVLVGEPINIRNTSIDDKKIKNKKVYYVDPDSLSFIIKTLNETAILNSTSKKKVASNRLRFCNNLIKLNDKLLSEDEQTTSDKFIELVTSRDINIADNVYINKKSPLVAKYMYEIRYAVDWKYNRRKLPTPGFASQPEKEAWKLLTDNSDERVRLWVAKHQFAPPSLLSKLSNDSSKEVLLWVLLNNNTPQNSKLKIAEKFSTTIDGILESYSGGYDVDLNEAIAKSNDASNYVLRKLSKHFNSYVQIAVASNPNTTTELLEIMSNNNDIRVRDAAKANLMNREVKSTPLDTRHE